MSALKRINGSSQPIRLNILGRALVELCMGRITTVCRLNIDHDIVSYGSQKEFIHCRWANHPDFCLYCVWYCWSWYSPLQL